MEYTIERYRPELKEEWDIFVSNAKNATFLFRRDYMDYHADRFVDFSLVARNGKGEIVALLPACVDDTKLVSHKGLTYGGWIGGYRHFDILALLDIQDKANEFLRTHGVKELIYKPVPHIYAEIPSDEEQYMLFRLGAQRCGCQISSAINLQTEAGPDKSQLRKARVATSKGATVEESEDYPAFWEILTQLLEHRYAVRPVHTLAEIELLRGRFPENIKLFVVKDSEGKLLGGTVMYLCGKVAHSQYIAASEEGKENNALTVLFSTLIDRYRAEGYHWFDFGISTERAGEILNRGLARQKISFGGRGITYDIYHLLIPDSTSLTGAE